jgi:peptidoglycan/xylan/chitin deacetylase (PgdA/CDA1 family)
MLTGCHYLIRFDDICPTMNWTAWVGIEAHLVRLNVRPILAVVPDNRDPRLVVDPPHPDFWEQVRKWQAMGWTIALHGYQHVYVNRNSGLLHLSLQSEFAGLSREEQEGKLKKGLAIFDEHGVRADAWVAPSHSFDRTTVKILGDLGVTVISDGLWPWPFTDKDRMTWVPQQLWNFWPRPPGVWTICNHHNGWTNQRVEWFGEMLNSYASKMTDMATVLEVFSGREQTLSNQWKATIRLLWTFKIRMSLANAVKRIFGNFPVTE